MNDLLKKILYLKKKSSPLIMLSFFILSFYLGYLFWYIVERLQLIKHLDISAPLFTFLVTLPIGMLMIVYKTVDSMFYNKRIKDILTMPIYKKHLFRMYLSEINAPFIALETLLFITLTLFTTDFLSIAKYYLTSVTLTFTFSLTLCCLLLIVLKLCRTTYSGYIMILFQYGGFLVILLLSKDLLTYLLFFQKTTSINLFLSIVQMSFFLPTVIIGSIVLSLIAFVLFDLIFLQNMYKIIDFEHNKLFYSKKYLFHIRMPYFFLERKRYYANKELWFYTILKNVVLFILLYKFITTTYSLNKTLINMVVIIFLCSINPFSVVAYSSDPHINKLVLITPIDSYKVYLSKVHMSFLLNFIIVLSFIVLNCFFMPDGNNTIFLILYGLANNYLGSFIGVLFDYLMPDYTKNKTELFHGNPNKFLSLIVIAIKTIFEFYIIYQLEYSKYLLPIATFTDMALLVLIFIFIYKKSNKGE
mgnify:FL=1